MRHLLFILMLLFSIFAVSCSATENTNETNETETSTKEEIIVEPTETTSSAITGKFAPPAGQTIFIVGQDNDTIDAYLETFPSPKPAGFTSYTSLDRLEGIDSIADYGAGRIYLDELANQNPESVLSIGFWLVDYLDNIKNGEADEEIDRFLDILAEYDRPIFLRFGYEFDGQWNSYRPKDFVEAWIYFYDKMEEKGVDNVAMVWQGAAYCTGRFTGAPIEDWYPGDEYVDWVGLSYFVQADCDFAPVQEMVDFAREHNKPMMIAEAAPQRYETGKLTYSRNGTVFEDHTAEEIWDEWYAPFFAYVYENQDVIRAIAYINAYWDSQEMWGPPYGGGYWGDSRVQANERIKERWAAELEDPLWLFSSPSLFETLGYKQ